MFGHCDLSDEGAWCPYCSEPMVMCERDSKLATGGAFWFMRCQQCRSTSPQTHFNKDTAKGLACSMNATAAKAAAFVMDSNCDDREVVMWADYVIRCRGEAVKAGYPIDKERGNT